MEFFNFKNYSLWMNFMIFAVSAGAVWLAGTRISRYADAIARMTGIGHAAVGLILLGGITSLPEVAVALFSALTDNPVLAVNNLLGGIAMQKAILAGSDALIGKDALTVVVSSSSLLLQATLAILILAIVAAAIVSRDVPLFGIGIWSWGILAAYAWAIWLLAKSEGRHPWQAQENKPRTQNAVASHNPHEEDSLRSVAGKMTLAGAVILVAGFLLSQTGDAIAEQTGLGQSFVGAVLLAFSTSLPEVSTVVAAMRLRQYEMAISDILGTNLFNVGLIFLVDAAYGGPPVLTLVGPLSLFAALLGIVLTVIYLIGLIERRNRTIAHMGIDSLATLLVYGLGVFIMYQLR